MCPECGKKNLDDTKFCTACGFDITDVEPKSNVTVSVTNEDTGRPVADAAVIIYNDDVSLEGTTGIVGDCTIKNIPYGEYTISVEADGYKTGSNNVTINSENLFEEINIKEKGSKSRLKIIGVLLIIIILLGAGLFVTSNMNNNQLISDLNDSDANTTIDEQNMSNNINSDDGEYKTVDFNGLFRMDLPVECDFSEISGDTNAGANHTWKNWNSESYYDSIYYFEDYNNLDDLLSELSIPNYKTDGNIIEFDIDGSYFVGVESSDNKFVLLSASNINELDNLKQSAYSIVFE